MRTGNGLFADPRLVNGPGRLTVVVMPTPAPAPAPETDAVLEVGKLGFPWPCLDPFLFCVHHLDRFPEGDERMAPDPALLRGRNIGMDFELRDGWRMYHGDTVPGFPRHPHRGFETVTLARQGFIDHADSLGATARFGHGDVQWMTAGRGIEHCEMFPLVRGDAPNTGELFQIWLNLPAAKKRVDPHFAMLWSEGIPRRRFADDAGRETVVTAMAGALPEPDGDGAAIPPAPPPDSWAADPDHEVAIWTIALPSEGRWTVPAASADVNRVLYFFDGTRARFGGRAIDVGHALRVRPDVALSIDNGDDAPAEVLLLQGRPIGEPVVQHGPFVMNSPGEIKQAFLDYQRGEFGRWPWGADDPVHPRDRGRFAIHADGRVDEPPATSNP